MTEWIDVNGAKIEKSFLEENISEAKQYAWRAAEAPSELDHTHCMICGLTISRESIADRNAYRSAAGWLCSYCLNRFVKRLD
jgi:hypothetical protein